MATLRFGARIRIALIGAAAAVACLPMAVHAAEDIPSLKMRIANSYPNDFASGIAITHFAKRIAELSGGKMTAKIYPSGTLYSEDKSTQAVLDGTIDMGLASASNHSPFTKTWRVIEVPYLFENRKQFREVIIKGPLGAELRKQSEKDGLKPIMIMETGGFRILGSNRLAKTPDDLKQMKIRTPQSPVPLEFWKTAGANPTVVPWPETYLALGSNTVDGVDAAWVSWPLGKLWEVTKFITDVRYSSVASVFDVSTKWWDKRTPKQREIILKAAREAEEISMQEEDKAEEKIKALLVKNGMQIYTPTPAEMDLWRKKGLAVRNELPDVSQDMLQKIIAASKEAN